MRLLPILTLLLPLAAAIPSDLGLYVHRNEPRGIEKRECRACPQSFQEVKQEIVF